jgi:hypothetical protein
MDFHFERLLRRTPHAERSATRRLAPARVAAPLNRICGHKKAREATKKWRIDHSAVIGGSAGMDTFVQYFVADVKT